MRKFRPSCFRFYGQLDTLRPAPVPERRRVWPLMAALVVIVAALPAVYLLVTADFPGSALFYSLQEDDPIVTALLHIARLLR